MDREELNSAQEKHLQALEVEMSAHKCDACGEAGSHTHPLTPCANVDCDNYMGCFDADTIEGQLGVCCNAACAVIALRDLRAILARKAA